MILRSQNKPIPSYFRLLSISAVVIFFLASTGCAMFKKEEVDTEQLSAEALYGRAKDAQQKSNWLEAIEAYQQLEARYPYGRFAKQAQLEIAYAHYKLGQDGLAIAAADRFISLNPTHASVDYAYYIKGLASFKEVPGFKGLLTGRTNLADRDPQAIADALAAFNIIVQRYPDSRYAVDANKRIRYLHSARAKREVGIARFYFERGAYVAAISRANEILTNYRDFPQAEDALGILYHSYQHMGMTELAQDAKRVLVLNYPQSGYLEDSTVAEESEGLLRRWLPSKS